VLVGDKVAFYRWDYGQVDLDEARIIASEKDVLFKNDNKAMPGIVAVNIIIRTHDIEIPTWVQMNNEEKILFGQVVASGWECTEACSKPCRSAHLAIEDFIFFRNIPDALYHVGQHTIVFDNICHRCYQHVGIRHANDMVLMKLLPEKEPIPLEVVA